MNQRKKIIENNFLLEIILVLVCFFAMFPIHKNLLTVPFYTDDNAIRYAAGHLFHYSNFDLRFGAGYPAYLIPPFFSANLWIFLFSSFDFLPAPFIYNVTHILWFLLTPIWSRIIAFSITQDSDVRQVMNIFLTPFLLLSAVVLIWAGSLHWGIIILLSFLFFHSAKKIVFSDKGTPWPHLIAIFLLTPIMMYINRNSIVLFTLMLTTFFLFFRKKTVHLIIPIISGIIVITPFVWQEFYFSLSQGYPFSQYTYIPYSPLSVTLRIVKFQFFKSGNYIFWILYPVNLALLIYGGINIANIRKGGGGGEEEEKAAKSLLWVFIGYIVLSLTVGGRPFFNTNPQRFLFLIYPIFIYFSSRLISKICSTKAINITRASIYFLLIILFSIRLYQYGPIMPKALPQPFTNLCQWLEKNTNTNARILLEGARHQFSKKGQLVHPLYDSHLYYLLGLKVKREFIGEILPGTEGLQWTYPWFIDGELFHTSIGAVPINETAAYLKLCNIGHVVCWTKKSEQYFHQNKNYFTHEVTIGEYKVFSVNKHFSFIEGGQGWTKVDYKNARIDVNLINSPEQIILKYHWWKNITTEPEVNIKPVHLGNAPVDFIGIDSPPPKLRIFFEGKQ